MLAGRVGDAVCSTRVELERFGQLDLARFPALQQGHLRVEKDRYYDRQISSPVAWHGSPGRRLCWLALATSPARSGRRAARGQPCSCPAAGGWRRGRPLATASPPKMKHVDNVGTIIPTVVYTSSSVSTIEVSPLLSVALSGLKANLSSA